MSKRLVDTSRPDEFSPSVRQPGRRPRRVPGWIAVVIGFVLVGPGLMAAAWGQQPMGQPTGIINRFLADGAGGDRPGFFYYGVNGADRGLGYRGSYMTLGGYIPYAEDDLGGFWAADLRGHLSTYGGFFSNVGMVRKQFIGGTLLGVGVFWDYDGDQNQYSDTTITDSSGSYVFAGGQTYQQVGVSGEWLTDFGNLRSNGYIPVGSTAGLLGPFVGNSLLAVNGINAALGGADLELGAYIPGLADWAGMISVGGYAFGNSRYEFPAGGPAVPWFGGVYTRLDMTFIRNWDFSLQANNDSYFDWTGFARLTYRMGSSRRRNVPDQVEQPMMRNEHIVRAHQTPEQAINPTTNLPWRIIHVDNSNAVVGTGNGTAENPFKTLADGRDHATQAFDVVYLHAGISAQTPYSIPVPPANPLLNPDPLGTPPAFPNQFANSYYFQANNQYLVGEGSSLLLNTVHHGPVSLAAGPNTSYPVIANAAGAAIVLTSMAGDVTNATVDHVQIRDSYVGISDGPAGLPANGYASVNDVQIVGTGPSQRGVDISHSQGVATFNFTNMSLSGLTRDGFFVDGGTGAPNVNISSSRITDTGGSAIYATNVFGTGRVRAEGTFIQDSTGPGVYAKDANLTFASGAIRGAGTAGVYAEDNSVVQVTNSIFDDVQVGVHATAQAAGAVLNATINENTIRTSSNGPAIILSTPSPSNTAEVRAYVIKNQLYVPANGDGILLFDGSPAGIPGTAELYVKAADKADLRALNGGATVREVFPLSATPEVPAPPNYDPSLFIPLPPQ